MNHASQTPLPARPLRIDGEAHSDLDARILQAELRLMEREAHLRRGVATFGQQVSAALKPSRLIQPAVLTAAVAVILLGWPSSRRAAPAQPQAAGPAPVVARPALFALMAGIPWTRVLSHAWPLLERLIARRRHEPAQHG